MKPYQEAFPVGTYVRIAEWSVLEDFLRTWKYHNPLAPEQLAFAGRVAKVEKVGFYPGGDVLYWLAGIGGTWHESCLVARDAPAQSGS